ncbi:MAG: hypothetical protein JW881_19375 [Spirochaetales bacterium]|nr:hypothetical protein [Spirochaetales bacterium]
MKIRLNTIILIIIYAIWLLLCSYAETGGKNDVSDNASADRSVKTIEHITIDSEKKEIRIKCSLAIAEGILEFLLVCEKGQTYESVLKIIGNNPSELHFALLLLGYEPLPFDQYHALLKNDDAVTLLKDKKCLLRCEIWHEGRQIPIYSLIRNRESGAEEELIWVFTGAGFDRNNKYVADYSRIYISIWPELTSVINLLSNAGNPYRGEYGFEMAAPLAYTMEDTFQLIIKGVN